MLEPGERPGNRLKDFRCPITVVTFPSALGADRHGVELGAEALDSGIRRRLDRRDFCEVAERLLPTQSVDVLALDLARQMDQKVENAMHLDPIAEACSKLAETMTASLKNGHFALVLGGDHSLSIGSLAAASTLGRLGVIWIDAHGDINTPDTTPSGNIHGMPLAISLGYGPRELVEVGSHFDVALEDLVYIGVRDLDPGERELLRQSAAMVFTIDSVDALGVGGVLREAIRRLGERGVEAVHVSLDLDVLDPVIFPATGTTAPGGLTYREVREALVTLRHSDLPIVSADIVELDPTLDNAESSANMAVSLATALLGEDLS